MTKKKTTTEDSKPSGETEALVLKKLSTEPIVLSNLVRDLSDELAYRPDEIISEIIRLQAIKRILIREATPYRTLPKYLFSPYSVWFWEIIVGTLSSLGLLLISSGPLLYVRFVLGGLLVLFLPGYSIVNIIYSKETKLDGLTRAAVSFVMSLATVTLVGFVLNYTPFGITLVAGALCIGILTLVLTFVAAVRKYAAYKLVKGLDLV